jgi:ABC-2 type transport system permease protein
MLAAIAALVRKDLLLLVRDRGAVFLTFAWPLVLAIFFGALGPGFGASSSGEATAMVVLAVDEDRSEASEAVLAELDGDARIVLEPEQLDQARERVRLGERPAYVLIQPGFGAAPHPLFDPVAPARTVELGVDPRRRSEAEVLEVALELAAWRSLGRVLDRDIGGRPQTAPTPSPLELRRHPLELSAAKLGSDARPPNPYAVTFPQGIIWAVLACAATFAVSLVDERGTGTLLRLAVAPVSRFVILAGKAGACLIAIVIMQVVLMSVAVLGFGVRPHSWGLLALALAATGLCFVGVMTLLAVLGRRTRSAAGLSWAVLMGMAMLGGGMLPLFMMPSWLQSVATASPVAWALTAIEGAVWRGFSAAEMALPCLGLVGLGVVCLAIGTRAVREL